MIASKPLSEMLSTLLDRRVSRRKTSEDRDIRENCLTLLQERAEVSGLQLAENIFNQYQDLSDQDKLAFFEFLNEELDVDPAAIAVLAEAYRDTPTPNSYVSLARSVEPSRQRLFRRLNEAPGATVEIVRMRRDLLKAQREHPHLARTDYDLQHLLRSWFNRGFLVMQQITWDSPATILEQIIAYEAVHEIRNWRDLRRRLEPKDRRCFAFFHPSMPTEPLIFVEVALTKGIPDSVQMLLAESDDPVGETDADTAVFYSISNCQSGLAGVSFGNSLIKQVVRDLSNELPNLKTFVTLSPIPGLTKWLDAEEVPYQEDEPTILRQRAANYLLTAKDKHGRPLDPVARFHLGNGAQVYAVHHGADTSERGTAQSATVMVNYLYDLKRISVRATAFSKSNEVAASSEIKGLAGRS